MRVKFLKEYYGSQVGTEADILDSFCIHDLIPRGIVEEVKKKEVKAAPRDKAVKGAAASK